MPHSLDIGKKRFRTLVGAASEASPQLPLVHSTDSYVLGEVLDTSAIAPQACQIFTGEALTYLFYGRPAFRPNSDAEPSSLKHYFPVCLIIHPTWAVTIKRIFPFDSGGFIGKFYDRFLHEKMKLGDFGLESDPSTPGRVISQFFGSVPQYLLGKPKPPESLDPSEFEAQSYLALIHTKDANAIDSRGSGIEVQTEDSLPLEKSVAAVILPSTFADGKIGAKLKSLGIDLLPYKIFERTRPSEHMSEITSICFNYYVRIGLISEQDLEG